jgi:hypothetical protein
LKQLHAAGWQLVYFNTLVDDSTRLQHPYLNVILTPEQN